MGPSNLKPEHILASKTHKPSVKAFSAFKKTDRDLEYITGYRD